MQKKLILISGSPCVEKTAVGTRLFFHACSASVPAISERSTCNPPLL